MVLIVVALLLAWAFTAVRQSERIRSLEASKELGARAMEQLLHTIGSEWTTREELYALIDAQPTLYT